MRIFYTPTGILAQRVRDVDLPDFDTTTLTHAALYIDIDETANSDLCRDLISWGMLGKYTVDPATQALLEDDAWQASSYL